MKRLISITLLVVIGVAGGLIYTSKPEAKAGFKSKSFRINLKDGGDSLGGYFSSFGENGTKIDINVAVYPIIHSPYNPWNVYVRLAALLPSF